MLGHLVLDVVGQNTALQDDERNLIHIPVELKMSLAVARRKGSPVAN